jgi:hypothetical protein
MSYAELMRRYKVMSELSDLTDEECKVYDAFLELGETETDVRILSDAWLRYHAKKNR